MPNYLYNSIYKKSINHDVYPIHGNYASQHMIIFLDIDGVLYPNPLLGKDHPKYCWTERFESIMRDFPTCQIVITSGLREKRNLDSLQEIFSTDIAARVVGVTPLIGLSINHCRQREIERYLQVSNQSSQPWLALDDVASEFEDGFDNLVLCNMHAGLDDAVEIQLREKLVAIINSDETVD